MALDLFEETMALLNDLEREDVPYAIAGALALAIHGVPRATTDIDLLVRRENVDAALGVASARGFGVQAPPMRFSDGLEVRRSTKVETLEMLTLDLLLVNDNLEPVWASRERVSTERGDVWVVSWHGLIDMKAWPAESKTWPISGDSGSSIDERRRDVSRSRHAPPARGKRAKRSDSLTPAPHQGGHDTRRCHPASAHAVRAPRRMPRVGAAIAPCRDLVVSPARRWRFRFRPRAITRDSSR